MGGCFTWSLDQVGIFLQSYYFLEILRIDRMMDLLCMM